MMMLLVAVCVPAAFSWWAMPRTYLWVDRRLTRRRLGVSAAQRSGFRTQTVTTPSIGTPVPLTTAPTPEGSLIPQGNLTLIELASLCDAVGRALRSGRGAADSLIDAIDTLHPSASALHTIRARLAGGESLPEVLSGARRAVPAGSDLEICLDLVRAAMVGSSLVAGGVEHAALVLRDIATMRADLEVASSQARLSARILTLLPLVIVLGGLVFSRSFRSSLTTPGVLVPLSAGLVLNRVGWRWIVRMLDSALSQASRFELAEVVDRICVSLMAGHTLPDACMRLEHSSPTTTRDSLAGRVRADIAMRVRRGDSLGDALMPLESGFGLAGRLFADLLVSADRDGLPIVASVARVAQDVRIERRRRVDITIRRIPVHLTMPLVTCILPGFLLTALVPLVAASLSSLTVQLPTLLAPVGP